MITNDNIRFLARYGNTPTIHEIIDRDATSGSIINHIGNNPNANPEIGSKIKEKEGYLYPHHHRLYEPSKEYEDTLHHSTAIESYLDHPSHSEDDLIRLAEKYRNSGIDFRPRNAGKKVLDHIVKNNMRDFAHDLVRYSSNPEIHEAAFNDDSDMKHDLRTRLSWNSSVDHGLHIGLLDDPHMGNHTQNI